MNIACPEMQDVISLGASGKSERILNWLAPCLKYREALLTLRLDDPFDFDNLKGGWIDPYTSDKEAFAHAFGIRLRQRGNVDCKELVRIDRLSADVAEPVFICFDNVDTQQLASRQVLNVFLSDPHFTDRRCRVEKNLLDASASVVKQEH